MSHARRSHVTHVRTRTCARMSTSHSPTYASGHIVFVNIRPHHIRRVCARHFRQCTRVCVCNVRAHPIRQSMRICVCSRHIRQRMSMSMCSQYLPMHMHVIFAAYVHVIFAHLRACANVMYEHIRFANVSVYTYVHVICANVHLRHIRRVCARYIRQCTRICGGA